MAIMAIKSYRITQKKWLKQWKRLSFSIISK